MKCKYYFGGSCQFKWDKEIGYPMPCICNFQLELPDSPSWHDVREELLDKIIIEIEQIQAARDVIYRTYKKSELEIKSMNDAFNTSVSIVKRIMGLPPSDTSGG